MKLKGIGDIETCEWLERQELSFPKIYSTSVENDNSKLLVACYRELTKDGILSQNEFVEAFIEKFGVLGDDLIGTDARLRRIYPSFVREDLFFCDSKNLHDLVIRGEYIDTRLGIDFILLNDKTYVCVKLVSPSKMGFQYAYIKNNFRHKDISERIKTIVLAPDESLGAFKVHSLKQIKELL